MSCRLLLTSGEVRLLGENLSQALFRRCRLLRKVNTNSIRVISCSSKPNNESKSSIPTWHQGGFSSRSFHITASRHGKYVSALHSDSPSLGLEVEGHALPPDDDPIEFHVDEALSRSTSPEEESNKDFLVVNFYKLVDIDDPQNEVARHNSYMQNKDINGRIYISSQGINAQYSGPQEDALAYAEWVKEDQRFSDLYVQVSPSFNGHAFPRLKLRYKPSLVQVGVGTTNLPITDPSSRAVPLSPKDWKQKLLQAQDSEILKAYEKSKNEKSVVVLDVRNGYEWDVGHFKGAQRPPVDCFKSTEFGLEYNEDTENDPLAIVDREHTDVLMYCTGGIRCDVYSAILRQRGFKNLYSLQGGVARYLIEENGENWQGNLFVFDSRLAVQPSTYKSKSVDAAQTSECNMHVLNEEEDFSKCSLCQGPLSSLRHRNCANLDCNKLFLCCEECAFQVKGCCSTECTSAPRQRPFQIEVQQYKRWYNYRGEDWLSSRPPDYVGKRAKRRQRRLERQQQQQQIEDVSYGICC